MQSVIISCKFNYQPPPWNDPNQTTKSGVTIISAVSVRHLIFINESPQWKFLPHTESDNLLWTDRAPPGRRIRKQLPCTRVLLSLDCCWLMSTSQAASGAKEKKSNLFSKHRIAQLLPRPVLQCSLFSVYGAYPHTILPWHPQDTRGAQVELINWLETFAFAAPTPPLPSPHVLCQIESCYSVISCPDSDSPPSCV